MKEEINTFQRHLPTSLFNSSSHAASLYISHAPVPGSNYSQGICAASLHSTQPRNVPHFCTAISDEHLHTQLDQPSPAVQTVRQRNSSDPPATCKVPSRTMADKLSLSSAAPQKRTDALKPGLSSVAKPTSLLRGYRLKAAQYEACEVNSARWFSHVLHKLRGPMLLHRIYANMNTTASGVL